MKGRNNNGILRATVIAWLTILPMCFPTPSFAQSADNLHVDPKTPQPELVIQQGHLWGVRTMAFSPDEKLLATGGDDDTIRLWDVLTGTLIRAIPVGGGTAIRLAFSSEGKTLAVLSGYIEAKVMLYDVSTSNLLSTIRPAAYTGSIALSPDGVTIALCGTNNEVSLWNSRTGKQLRTIRSHQEQAAFARFSSSGSLIAVIGGGRDDGYTTAEVWDTNSDALVHTFHTSREIWSADFSRDDNTLVLGTDTFSSTGIAAELWDLKTNARLKSLSAPGFEFQEGITGGVTDETAVGYTSDAKALVVSDGLGVVRVWDLATARVLRTISTSLYFWNTQTGACAGTVLLGKTIVQSMSVTPEGRSAVISGDDGRANVWDLRNRNLLAAIDKSVIKERWDACVAITPDGRHVAICGYRKRTSSKEDRKYPQPPPYKPDSAGFMEVWNVARRVKEREILGIAGDVDALAFSSGGNTLFCKGSTRNAVEWKWRSRTFVTRTSAEWGNLVGGIGSQICTSRDSRVVAVRADPTTVYLWNMRRPGGPVKFPEYGDNAN